MAKTRSVALVMNAATPYDRKCIRGVADYAEKVTNWTLYVEEDPLRLWPGLSRWRGDGVIADFHERQLPKFHQCSEIPVVRIGGGPRWGDPSLADAYFETDNEAIPRLAAEHLIERGYQRLAFCGLERSQIAPWPKERGAWPTIRARIFKQRAAEAGLPCSIYAPHHATGHTWKDLERELASWLASLEKPVGLMACNDTRALHVLSCCRKIGVRVPDDIGLIGVDNDELLCELSRPPLTSVEQGSRRMGYQAAELLDRLMSGRKVQQSRFVIPPEGVVVRRSTDSLVIEDAHMAAAVRFIHEHACDRIHVSDVARAAKMSRSVLRIRFNAARGRSVHSEIQRQRIEQVRQLLTTTSLTLKQISGRAGFKHVQHMTTVFRQAIGQTPAKYRKQSLL